MIASYDDVKNAILVVIDDFSEKEVIGQYGEKYGAETKLTSLGISTPVLAAMPSRLNKSLRQVVGNAWQRVGPIDLVEQKMIGDLIVLACAQSGTGIPDGEPT